MADRGLEGTLAGSGDAATAPSATTSVPAAGAGDGSSVKTSTTGGAKKKGRASRDAASIKRRCVSTACIACRKRKSKCDGNTPRCAACSSVYGTGKFGHHLNVGVKIEEQAEIARRTYNYDEH